MKTITHEPLMEMKSLMTGSSSHILITLYSIVATLLKICIRAFGKARVVSWHLSITIIRAYNSHNCVIASQNLRQKGEILVSIQAFNYLKSQFCKVSTKVFCFRLRSHKCTGRLPPPELPLWLYSAFFKSFTNYSWHCEAFCG